jgi:2-methylcitrate dehydratase PrpD
MATWSEHPGKLMSKPITSISVISKNGTYNAESNELPGDSWNPRTKLSDEELIEKFRNNCRSLMSEQQIDRIVEFICTLDKKKDVGSLSGLVAVD